MTENDPEIEQLIADIDSRLAVHARNARQAAATKLYAEARAAAEKWTDFLNAPPPTKAIERLQAHCVDLAAADPSIRIEWLQADATSTALVGIGNASALPHRSTVLCPPVIDHASYATVLHELGHCRDVNLYASNTLRREASAWMWARSRALVWDSSCQQAMDLGLRSYIRAASRADVLSVIEAEKVLSPMAFKQELVRRWAAGTQ